MPGSGAFEWSTPADAQMNPCRVWAMTSGPRSRDDLLRLAQDRLDLTRVALVAGQLARLRRRLEVVDPHDPALGLRDRLLRDDDDVAVSQLDEADDERGEVVALAGSPAGRAPG